MSGEEQDQGFNAEQILEELRKIPRGQVSLSQVLGMHREVLSQLVVKAQGMIDQGHLEEAEELLTDLSRVEIRIPNIPFLLGVCRYERHDFPAAVEAFDLAVERGAETASDDFMQQAHLCRAQACLRAGEIDRAIEDLGQASGRGDPALAESARTWLEQLEKTKGSA